jgi:TolA-binding protein
VNDATPVSREEFNMLRDQVAANLTRLDGIDTSGTRGVGVVQQQLMDLKGDVTELRVRLEKHEGEHQQVARDQRTARRWLVTAGIALLVALEGPMGYIIVHVR